MLLRNGYSATRAEVLAVVLIRLAFPVRLLDLLDLFGHSRAWLSSLYSDAIEHLYKR
jgi:hypothetical protein